MLARKLCYYKFMPDECVTCSLKQPPNNRVAIDRVGGGISFLWWIIAFINRVAGLYAKFGADMSRSWIYRLLSARFGEPSDGRRARDQVLKELESRSKYL